MLYDQDNDVDPAVQKANMLYLQGFVASWLFLVRDQLALPSESSFQKVYMRHNYATATGFEEGCNYYIRTDLDEPENSDKLWDRFNKSSSIG